MTQVQATLDRVVSLLQPGQSSTLPLNPLAIPSRQQSTFSLEDWVQKNAHAAYDGVELPNQLEARQSLSSVSKVPRMDEGSDQEDEGSEHSEALGIMKGMLNQEASRRLQADGHDTRRAKGKRAQLDDILDQESARRRRGSSFDGDWVPNTMPNDRAADPVALGLCTELEGGSLFDM